MKEDRNFWFIDHLADAAGGGIREVTGYKSNQGDEYFCEDGWVGTIGYDIFDTEDQAVESAKNLIKLKIDRWRKVLDGLEKRHTY